MLKHEACAAAMSSSGLVLPCSRSALLAQVIGSSAKAPLSGLTCPPPLVRSPSHVASARLIAAMFILRKARIYLWYGESASLAPPLGSLASSPQAHAEHRDDDRRDDAPRRDVCGHTH